MNNLPDIEIHRAFGDASATSYATCKIPVLGKVAQLVHNSLSESLFCRRPGVDTGGLVCKKRELAGIPDSDPLPCRLPNLIQNVEAMACWTEIGADTASETGFG